MAAELDYVPLSRGADCAGEKTWTSEITSGGHPV